MALDAEGSLGSLIRLSRKVFELSFSSKESRAARWSSPESSERSRQTYVKQINDMVYLVHTPTETEKPQLELVFFHGLDLEVSGEAHVKTWMSRDGSEFWLTWVAESFPDSRILTISYQSSGPLDMYRTAENLLYLLTSEAHVGSAGCPVVFVGHCLGGLILKELCLFASDKVSRNSMERPGLQRVHSLLSNLKGMLFYGTSHTGSVLGAMLRHGVFQGEGAPIEEMKILKESSARRNQNFSELRSSRKWVTFGIAETRDTYLSILGKHVCVRVSSEASTRPDMDQYYSADADHHEVCRPKLKTDNIFLCLKHFLENILKEVPAVIEEKEKDWMTTTIVHDNDKKYVPVKESQSAVINAIEGSSSHYMILLYGGLGKGKTTLASYICKLYSEYGEKRNVFDHVIWVSCAECFISDLATKQLEILHRHCPSSLPEEMKSVSEIGQKSGLKARVAEAFRKFFNGKKILMILDGVVDVDFLRGMWKASKDGKNCKIVITSQLANICDQFKDDSVSIKMEAPDQEEARKILASLVGLEDKQFPPDIMVVVDKIINATERNLLALACVASNFSYNQNKKEKKEWLYVWEERFKYLDNKDDSIVLGRNGDSVRMSLWEAMKLRIDTLNTKDYAKSILYLVYACKGDSVPEEVIYILGTALNMAHSTCHKAIMELSMGELLKLTPDTRRKLDKSPNNHELQESRAWSVHSLMKLYLENHDVSKLELSSVMKKLLSDDGVSAQSGSNCQQAHTEETVESDKMRVIGAVCALYFDHHHSDQAVSSAASKACDISNLQGVDDSTRDLRRKAVEPLIWLLDKPEDDEQWTKVNKSCVRKVLLSYISWCKLDYENLINILELNASPSAQITTLRAITYMLSLEESSLLDENTIRFLPAVVHLLNMKEHVNASVQEEASKAISAVCWKAADDKFATFVVRMPRILDTLVDLLANPIAETIVFAANAANALAGLCYARDEDIHTVIANKDGVVERLLYLSQESELDLQVMALAALGNLALTTKQSLKLQIAERVGLLSTIVNCLSADGHPHVQAVALQSLVNIAASPDESFQLQRKVLNERGALAGIVKCLSNDTYPVIQRQAGMALANLALTSDELLRLQITEQEGAVAGLIRCLSKHGHPDTQASAALAIANLAFPRNTLLGSNMAEEGVLEGLASCLLKDDHPKLQIQAAAALGNLARSPNQLLKFKIANEGGTLSGLVNCLSKDEYPMLELNAARTLQNLMQLDLKEYDVAEQMELFRSLVNYTSKINHFQFTMTPEEFSYPANTINKWLIQQIAEQVGAVTGLVKCLSKDDHILQEVAASAVACMASSSNILVKSKIAEEVGALAGLVSCFSRNERPNLQTFAAAVLANLADCTDELLKLQIAAQVGALAGLVKCLSRDDWPVLKDQAARALGNLVDSTVQPLQLRIVEEVGFLAGLINCLFQDDHPGLVYHAAHALEALSRSTMEPLKFKIVNQVGFLPGLVNCLSKDEYLDLQSLAALILKNLASSAKQSLKLKIVEQVAVLRSLVKCLSKDEHPKLQIHAALALAHLASAAAQLQVAEQEGVLTVLVNCLSKDNYPNLQTVAAQGLAVLTCSTNQLLKFQIAEQDGLLAGLVSCLSKHDHPDLQTRALLGLRSLATQESLRWRIADVEGFLVSLGICLSNQDQHNANSNLQIHAAELSEQLARDEVVKVVFKGVEGILQGLLNLVGDDTPLTRYSAAKALLRVDIKLAEEVGLISRGPLAFLIKQLPCAATAFFYIFKRPNIRIAKIQLL